MRLVIPWFVGLAAGSVAAVTPNSLERMPQAAVQEAFQVLLRDYIGAGELDFAQLNRAALEGLLSRLALGAEVLPPQSATGAAVAGQGAWLSELLSDGIRLLRPTGFGEAQLEAMRLALQAAIKQPVVEEVILDLRAPCADEDLERAAAWLNLFVPAGEVAFKLRQIQGGERTESIAGRGDVLRWSRPLLLLVDGQSNNVAEVIAAVLQHRGQAVVLGSVTRGAAVQYETRPLGAGWRLRFARAEMLLPNNDRWFRRGVQPQLPVAQDLELKAQLFASQGKREALLRSLHDQAPPRLNEAALLAGRNPDLEALLQRPKTAAAAPVARDLVLQRALDLLLARRQWNRKTKTNP